MYIDRRINKKTDQDSKKTVINNSGGQTEIPFEPLGWMTLLDVTEIDDWLK